MYFMFARPHIMHIGTKFVPTNTKDRYSIQLISLLISHIGFSTDFMDVVLDLTYEKVILRRLTCNPLFRIQNSQCYP